MGTRYKLWLSSITDNHAAKHSDHRTLSSASTDGKAETQRVN